MPICPIGPNISSAPPGPSPPTPHPPAAHNCTLVEALGCYNDEKTGSVLPDYQRQLHDIVTQVRNNVFSFPNFLSRKKMIGQDRLGTYCT